MGGSFSHGAAHSPQIPPDSIEFVGRNGVLYANNIPFSIKGCNWFGSEAYNGPPNGLDVHSIGWYLDFLKRHNFNAIRLLFNHEHVLKDDIVETPQRERPCPDETDSPEPGLARLPSTGQRVMISGLVKAAQHNGSEGVVTGHVPMQGGILRCNVSCDSGEKLCVQPENLMLVNQGAAVFSI